MNTGSSVTHYLPASILDYIRNPSVPDKKEPPFEQQYETCVLFADVSGYTALCEACASKGPGGDEFLARHLNSYFGQLVRIVLKEGGDVFKYAGDALIVVWPPSEEDIVDIARRATQCALDIHTSLNNIKLEKDVELCIKVGVGVGKITIIHVGGVKNRMEYLPTGEPLVQAFNAEHHATKKEAMLSPKMWEKVQEYFPDCILRDDGYAELKESPNNQNLSKRSVYKAVHGTKNLAKNVQDRIGRYVPSAVIPYMLHGDEKWLSEIRKVTVLFVNLGFDESQLINIGAKQANVDKVQNVLSAVQTSVYQFEGSLNKFLMDDKGSTLIAVFGLPPLAHEDDPTRGVRCAIMICDELKKLDHIAHIGVSSGEAFCGVVGSRGRREYSVLGDTVNLSARLMQFAGKKNFSVVVDGKTKVAAQHYIPFVIPESGGSIQVKGKTKPVQIFQPNTTHRLVRRIGPIKFGADYLEIPNDQSFSPDMKKKKGVGKVLSNTWHTFLSGNMYEVSEKQERKELPSDKNHRQHQADFVEELGRVSERKRSPCVGTLPKDFLIQVKAFGGYSTGQTIRHRRQTTNTYHPRKVIVFLPNGNHSEIIPKPDCKTILDLIKQALDDTNDYPINQRYVLTTKVKGKVVELPESMIWMDLLSIDVERIDEHIIFRFQEEVIFDQETDPLSFYKERVLAQLHTFLLTSFGGTIIVTSEMGLGKSHLLNEIIRQIPENVKHLEGHGAPFEYAKKLRTWRGVFMELLQNEITRLQGSSTQNISAIRRELILSKLKLRSISYGNLSAGELAPVLNEVFPILNFEETEITKSLKPEARTQHALNLLVNLMDLFTEKRPQIIVIDDAAYMDPLSWSLVLRITREIPTVFLLIAMRPLNLVNMGAFQSQNREAFDLLIQDVRVTQIQLPQRNHAQIEDMIVETLKETEKITTLSRFDLPQRLKELIVDKCDGNPFISKSVTKELLNQQCITFINGRVHWSPEPLFEIERKKNVLIEGESKNRQMPDHKQNHKQKVVSASNVKLLSRRHHSRDLSNTENVIIDLPVYLPIPSRVHSFLGSMMDRLSILQSMILKTASFLLREKKPLTYDMIKHTCPLNTIPQNTSVEQELSKLVRLKVFEKILPDHPQEIEAHYRFCNSFLKDVAYMRMLGDQKKRFKEKLRQRKKKLTVKNLRS